MGYTFRLFSLPNASSIRFRHKGLEKLFSDGSKKGIQPQHTEKLEDILDRLDASAVVGDMDYPGSDLHRLKGRVVAAA